MTTETGFRGWCIVELMGHVTLAGYVSEQELGGTKMLRIDVPESERGPKFTKLVGAGSIYGITPVDEDTVQMMCRESTPQPFASYELQAAFRRYYEAQLKQDMPRIRNEVRRSLTHEVAGEASVATEPNMGPGRDEDWDEDDLEPPF